jgi:anthranilate phosphoribosyltransferase
VAGLDLAPVPEVRPALRSGFSTEHSQAADGAQPFAAFFVIGAQGGKEMLRRAISRAAGGQDLSEIEMMDVMETIMAGRATPAQIGALLVALRIKGETTDEITGAARVMRSRATTVPGGSDQAAAPLIDVVGTGGDGAKTFNVSTTTAFVVAGAGARVAKHGNRAVSGACGSADLLEALGVRLDLAPIQIGDCIDQVGLGFMYAPLLHPAMRYAATARREIGLRTMFNLLGPLTNPAGASVLVVGVYDPELVTRLAEVLRRLGTDRAFVVYGQGGLDEVTVTGATRMARLKGGRIREMTIAPEDLGLPRAGLDDVSGGAPATCRDLCLDVLSGRPGARRDMVVMNAAVALVAADLAIDFREGAALAAAAIDSGAAKDRLDALVTLTNRMTRRAAEA